jgi:hypothetical protein
MPTHWIPNGCAILEKRIVTGLGGVEVDGKIDENESESEPNAKSGEGLALIASQVFYGAIGAVCNWNSAVVWARTLILGLKRRQSEWDGVVASAVGFFKRGIIFHENRLSNRRARAGT